MRPGVIVSLSRYTDLHPLEGQAALQDDPQPLDRLTYCIEELDREMLALSAKVPCESVLLARNEISSLKSLLDELQLEDKRTRKSVNTYDPPRDKPDNYRRVIQELVEERERLQQEINDLNRKESQLKLTKSASPATVQDWQTDFDE